MLNVDSPREAVMDVTPGVVIWRVRRSPHVVSCVAEQVGEECFELRIFDGRDLVHTESFEEPPPLLRRAEALRLTYEAEGKKETGRAKRPLART
jgi:hypothetical protein